MNEDHEDEHMHLDVLVEDRFSEFVADGLEPTVVVGASAGRVNLGIESDDGAVSIYLGGLSPDAARALGTVLREGAELSGDTATNERQTWVLEDAMNAE